MTAPAGTFQTFTSIGNREDLTDLISNISPTETPFVTMAGRTKAKGKYHEWQTDELAAAAANAQIEGDDATALTATPTVRLGNHCQILAKTIQVSGTQEAVDKAGRDSEIAYQLAKRGKELKRDLENAAVTNQASTAGAAASARTMASVESWLATNKTSLGTGGTPTTPGFSGSTVAAPTDNSSPGTFTVDSLKSVIRAAWTAGGEPNVIMVGPFNKTKASAFAGIATLYREASSTAKGTSIIGAADVYVSDFGEHRIVPNRFQRDKTALVLDMDYFALAYLRPMQKEKLAKTGDSEKWQILTEVTLESKNEKASGKVTDLTVS